uniref:Uncharacterized protein n=1 Tax=Palisada sp. TaxID=1955416 RepID=A0A1Z1MRW6_9FLOR|nr:hypothetical protein [Palisada sp.]
MVNSVFLFRLYIIFALLFLVPLSFFITRQIYFLFNSYFVVCNLIGYSKENVLWTLSDEVYINLFNFYVTRKKFFLCISLAELFFLQCPSKRYLVYISLAYCYKESRFFYAAEYYYLRASSLSKDNISILVNLLKIYNELGDFNKVSLVENQIETLNFVNSSD